MFIVGENLKEKPTQSKVIHMLFKHYIMLHNTETLGWDYNHLNWK